MEAFSEGLHVSYLEHYGYIRFISDRYLTICIKEFPGERNRNVCLLVFRDNYSKIKLIKESEK